MKKLFLGLLAVSTMAMVGCSQDEEQFAMTGGTFEDFTGEIITEGTRTSMGEDKSVLWSEDDAISLFKKTGYHQKYAVKTAGTTSTTFKYADESSQLGSKPTMNYAAYPYAVGNSINGSTLTLDLSSLATQAYTANTFENGKAVMVAKSATTELAFTNAFSLANIQLKAEGVEAPGDEVYVNSITIESATLPLAGTATVDMSQDRPAAVFAEEGAKSITLSIDTPVQLTEEATNFYILMPAVTFPENDLTITIQATVADEDKEFKTTMNSAIEFKRSYVTTLTKTIEAEDWTGSTEITNVIPVENVDAANTALETNTGVQVANIAAGETITVPAKTVESATVEHVIDLRRTTLPAGSVTIEVKEATGTEEAVKELNVVVNAAEDAANLIINAPSTTVTITTADGTVINTIEATTADNTLIIGEGVTINHLDVKVGNVKMEGGEIKEITNSTSGTLYITNVNGTLPSELPDNTIVVYENTEHKVVLNDTYSADNILALMNYSKDVLNITQLSFTLSSGKYNEVVKVTGGKNITFEPKTLDQEVSIAGLDHQSNGNPSTILVKNITLDNTLQTEGWFTGTSQKINPCVGAWGGNFTFENCKFVVEGTSKKETGVMTWWTTSPTISLTFNNCEFVGYNDASSARAMQIYGNVDMTVTDCTFKTLKDYSLKYVGNEGNVATFEGNKVYNSQYLVQLGSAPYPGENYTVNINNTTLGEGVTYYYIDNEENQKVYIDGALPIATAEELNNIVNSGTGEVKIKLVADIESSEIITINKAITLDGNGKTLTYTGTDRAFQITGGIVVINNLTIEMPNASEGNRGINLYNGGTNSSIDVTLNGVTIEGGEAYAVNIGGGKDNKLTINNSTLTGYAAINVNAASVNHTINVDSCTLTGYNHNTGYDFGVVVIDGTNAHTLKIANTTITPNNNEGVETTYNQLVVGANCDYEVDDKVTDIAVRNILANGLYYTDLQAAVNEANENSTVTLLGDIQIDNFVEIKKSITLDLGENDINTAIVDGKHRTALYVNSDIEVTIKGSTGKVTGNQGLFVKKGLVKIYGGHFHGTNDNGEAVYVNSEGKVEIYGGTFSGEYTKNLFVLNEYDSTRDATDIKVYGGTFVGFDPANNAAEGEGTNFVADGYQSATSDNGETYVVTKK